MAVHLQNQPFLLYTCRYWALGPKCPNVDSFGTVTCLFAHHDTGRLASEVLQKGTCLPWKRFGFCGRGQACWYEHRDAGVTGLHQGTIDLTGFELEVADAAFKGRFNTSNHPALFDLIWSVKRLAIRTGDLNLRTLPRPPRDPIYPDRYRPNGVGDNTQRKRRPMVIHPPRDHSVELKFHPIKPLMRKRALPNSKAADQANVIDLTGDSDGEDLIDLTEAPSNANKRQKMTAGVDIKTPANAIPGRPSFLPIAPSTISLKRQRKENKKRNKTSVASNILTMPTVPRLNANAAPFLPKRPLTEEEEITKQLLLVKVKLDDARKTMNTCQATMKALFDTHYNKFDNEEMMNALQGLSTHMNMVFDGGKEGAADVDKAITSLKRQEEDKIS